MFLLMAHNSNNFATNLAKINSEKQNGTNDPRPAFCFAKWRYYFVRQNFCWLSKTLDVNRELPYPSCSHSNSCHVNR